MDGEPKTTLIILPSIFSIEFKTILQYCLSVSFNDASHKI